jgi:protein MpaA
LTLEVFGDGPERILIFGGIHGSEPTSAVLAAKLADHLRVNWALFAGKTIAILAEANPDGLARRSRTNANGVDLNRNFPAENWRRSRRGRRHYGSAPASEPETRAVIRAVKLVRPDRIVAIHSIRRGRHCNNFDGPARDLARSMASLNGYPVKATMGYPTPGSFGSWAGVDRRLPTITLELPSHLSGRQCWRENADALLAFLQAGTTQLDRNRGEAGR